MRPNRSSIPPEQRFWAKVDRPPADDACWLWQAAIDPKNGYGKFGRGEGRPRRTVSTHRYSWELAFGPVPDGLCVLHNCDVRYSAGDITYRRCVNPAHLWLGTNQDNTLDMFAKGRGAVGDRHPARSRGDYLPRGDNHRARRDPSYLPRGEAHVNAKLTGDKVREIRRLLAAGMLPQYRIAAMFGVTPGTIVAIRRGKTWTHVKSE